MAALRRFFLRRAQWFRPARGEPDLATEVSSQLELLQGDFERCGMSPHEAAWLRRARLAESSM
jgi:hypothetical protein